VPENKAAEAKEPKPSTKGEFSIRKILLGVLLAVVTAGGGVLWFARIRPTGPLQDADGEQVKLVDLLEGVTVRNL